MAKGRLEDRRLGFQNDVKGEFTMKNAKIGATKGDEPFIYAICKPSKGSGKSVFISAGDLQNVAKEAGLKDSKLPFQKVDVGDEVDADAVKVNESFTFAIADNKILVN